MLFKVMTKEAFRQMFDIILETNEIIGPKKVAANDEGKPIHQYLPVGGFDELDLDYETTEYSAKTYFLPYQENLSSYRFTDSDWEQQIKYRLQPRALVGLHSCDINALLKLDKVMSHGPYPSPYYVSRRRNTFIVGIDHEPCGRGFCNALGTDVVTHGFDLFLTDIGDRYFVAIDSDLGFNVLKKVETREVDDDDTREYLRTRSKISRAFKTSVNMANLPNLLDIEFESDVWRRWGSKCLSCGSCGMVCPTCYCYGISEHVSMDFTEGAKTKQLYSCNIVDFATVAGGHNFRPDRVSRLKYRYYHQHRGFMEIHEEPKCVGCGRCSRVCLAGINPPDLIGDLQAEDNA